jgi:hypothetical protein
VAELLHESEQLAEEPPAALTDPTAAPGIVRDDESPPASDVAPRPA